MMSKITWYDYSSNFSDNSVVAGFTNRNFPYFPPEDRRRLAQILNLDFDNLVIPQQVHSKNVAISTKQGIVKNTDGAVTNNRELVLSLQVADCIPIFLFYTQNHNIGLVHAGWKGVQLGIIEEGIAKMQQLGSNPSNIEIVLGPAIRQCCFEVGPTVSKLFDSKFQIAGKDDRMQLDLQGIVIDKLINGGVSDKNIIDKEKCTCCSDEYHSYRRDGEKAGRMVAVMGIGGVEE